MSAAATPADTSVVDERPQCPVVGAYCEALGWLRRELHLSDQTVVCCRHYWGDLDEAAS